MEDAVPRTLTIEPWQCEVVYTDSGFAELDCIFKTRFPADGPEDVWVVSRYEPSRAFEFVRVNGIRAMRYSIRLHEDEDGTTKAVWTQFVTGLNPQGNELTENYSDDLYAEKMGVIERMLNHYLTTGETMPHCR